MNLDIGKIIKVINRGLLVMSLFLFLCLGWIFVETLLNNNWHLSISVDGIKNMQIFWGEFSPLIVLFGSSLTLWLASSQLAKYINTETVNALGKLRQLLNSDEKKKIHYYLLEKCDKKDVVRNDTNNDSDLHVELSNVDLFDYIGTIELGAIMLQRGVISYDEFYSQFGYRVENLWKNEAVKKHIKENAKYYKKFLYIVKKLGLLT